MPGFKSGGLADQEGVRHLPEREPGRAVFENLDELAALPARGLEVDTLGEDMHLHHHVLLGLVLQVLPGRESIPATVSRHLEVRHAGVQGFQERSDDQASDGRRVVLEDDQGISNYPKTGCNPP